MARKEDYDWKNMPDERLVKRLEQELWKAQHKNRRVERSIAWKNAEAIIKEQSERYERKFLG